MQNGGENSKAERNKQTMSLGKFIFKEGWGRKRRRRWALQSRESHEARCPNIPARVLERAEEALEREEALEGEEARLAIGSEPQKELD
jgi:hypothetical protein